MRILAVSLGVLAVSATLGLVVAQDRPARELAYWKEWLLRLVETRLVERVLGDRASSAAFEKVAAEVAARKKDPYAAVNEILSKGGA